MKVAVTGGAGFIGRRVVHQLRWAGHDPVVIDRAHGRDVRGPLTLSQDGAVIHLAGMLGTHELFDAIDEAIDVNIKGTLNILRAAKAANCRYVGITMPAVFPSIYTATKIAAVGLERAFHSEGLPVSRVRAFNAFGSGQAHGPGHPQKIIPTFATEAWAGRPIPIWGDGTQTVDLIHVDDLARMLVDALGHGDDVTFDGGTGLSLSVNDIAEVVLRETGSKAGVVHLPMRRGEVPTKIVANGEGWDRLTWQPKFQPGALYEAIRSYRYKP